MNTPLQEPELVTHDSPGNNQLLYFTSSSLAANDDLLFFLGDRGGSPNLYLRDLSTGQERLLSDNRDGALKSYVYFDGEPYEGFGKASVSLDPGRATAYYLQGRTVRAVNSTGHSRVIAELPPGEMTAFTHLSSDGARLCVPTVDERALDGTARLAGKPPYDIDERVRSEKLRSYLRVYDTQSGELLLCEPVPSAWITHVQFSPVNPDWILYNHEWASDSGIRRIWLWNGKEHKSLRDEKNGRHRGDWVCHEMWERDGSAIIYHGADRTRQNFVGRMRPDGSEITEIPLLGVGEKYGHFTVGAVGELASDGYYAEPGEASERFGGSWITRLEVAWSERQIRWIPLCRNESSWDSQDSHPHPIFDHSRKYIYFTSDRSGKREVYRIAVR